MKSRIYKNLMVAWAGAFMGLSVMGSALPVYAAKGYEDIGKATMNDVGSLAMTAIPGDQVLDGTYDIEVESSSNFFKIESTELTVKDGKMTAKMTMSSGSYECVYMGTPEEAAKASADDYIPDVNIDYYDTFTIPVEALNTPIDCAAFSIKKKKWYARQLVFLASSLPEGTFDYDFPDYDLINDALDEYETNHPEAFTEASTETEAATGDVEAMEIDMKDGEYSIEVSLAGGSGRASVTSPTWLYVKNGEAYAKLLWSSSYYDYMIVGGKKFFNETTDGSNSTFTIPITAMDEAMIVTADTTAMGDPLEIEYTLTFYKDSIGSKSNVPQEGAKKVIVIAFIVMILGGIINYFVKKRRGQ